MVLIILATISINAVFGENGIIKRAEASKSLHELQEEKQRLELIKPEVLADNLGKMTIDQYVEALKENKITDDADITTNSDGSKTVITDTGYSVLIEQDGERNVKITIEGKAGNLPPRIKDATATQEGTNITVTVDAIRTEGATLKYYYKTSSGSYQTVPITADSTSEFTITGVDEKETYTIKVEITNEHGTATREITVVKEVPKGPNGKPLVNKDTVPETEHDKIIGEDKLGNQVVVPNGFKIAEDSGEDVEDGIVIEDSVGNQFVWVPVSNIDGDGVVENQSANGLITRKNGSKVQITLGRYSFATTSPGTPILVQKGSEYNAISNESNLDETYKIKGYGDYYHYEFSAFRESNYKKDATGQNATAYNLKGFIESVRDNHGYYIARYEASYGSGSTVADYKPLSQKSTANSTSSMNYAKGTLWNFIAQGDASKVSRNMYVGNKYVESDLLNSCMWDTAIVYIQVMGNENYANATRGSTTTLKNTGETEDEKCHIFDMAGNTVEWTTEYSTYTYNSNAYPCTRRGGGCGSNDNYVARRQHYDSTYRDYHICFRIGLYAK